MSRGMEAETNKSASLCQQESEATPQPWTDQDRTELLILCRQNLSNTEIAHRLGRSRRAVSNMTWRLGLRRREPTRPWTTIQLRLLRQMLDEGRSLQQIAEATGHSRPSVANKLRSLKIKSRKSRQPWTEEECDTIRRLHAGGAGLTTIAEAVPGRSALAIFRKLCHLVGPAPFSPASGPSLPSVPQMAPHVKPVVVKAPPPPPPQPVVTVSVDAMVRWLRSRDFIVLRLPTGWRIDRHILDEAALVDFVNTRRRRLNLPLFACSFGPQVSSVETVCLQTESTMPNLSGHHSISRLMASGSTLRS